MKRLRSLLWKSPYAPSAKAGRLVQPVDATPSLNISAGAWNPRVLQGVMVDGEGWPI